MTDTSRALAVAGLVAVFLSAATAGSGIAAQVTPSPAGGLPLDAEFLLAYARGLPPGGGNSSTGPGGATLPAVATASPSPGGAKPPSAPAAGGGGPLPIIGPLPLNAPGRFRPKEVLVLLQPDATTETAEALAQTFGLQLEVFVPSLLLRTPLVRLRIPDARTEAAVAAALRADPRVRGSQRNFVYVPAADQSASSTSLPQYALDLMGIAAAQTEVHSERTPLIAVIDTGIDETHPDLAGSVVDRFDAVGDGAWDSGAHGTSIASILAAHGQMTGIVPKAKLLSIRVMASTADGTSEATSESLVRGIDWAAKQQADVINMSLAGPQDSFVSAEVSAAIAQGFIIVAAAGNDGPNALPDYPAAVQGVIAVTATDQNDGLYVGANHGSYISVAAPGVDIMSATLGGSYTLVTGTSQATANVSGVIAMMREIRPDLTPAAALALLQHSAKDLGPPGTDDSYGAGRVDAAGALRALSNGPQASQ